MVFSEDKIVPDPSKSIEEGAITLWDKRSWSFYRLLVPVCEENGIDISAPFYTLSPEQKKLLFYGNIKHPELKADPDGTDFPRRMTVGPVSVWTDRPPFEQPRC